MPSYLIVGAGGQLGLAWLQFLAEDPANTVIGLVRDKDAAQQHLTAQGDCKGVIQLVQGDIRDVASLRSCAEEISTITEGSLDVLINNAATIGKRSSFASLDDLTAEVLISELDDTFVTNVMGTAHLVNTFLPLIRKGKERKFVGVSSLLADMDLAIELSLNHACPYSVSKVAANALLSKYHAAIGVEENILFLSISPGVAAKGQARFTEDEMRKRVEVGAKLKQYAPEFTKPLLPEESVRMQWKVIVDATVQSHGGRFVSHTGTDRWL